MSKIDTLEIAKEIRATWSGVKRKVKETDWEEELEGGSSDVKKQRTVDNSKVPFIFVLFII